MASSPKEPRFACARAGLADARASPMRAKILRIWTSRRLSREIEPVRNPGVKGTGCKRTWERPPGAS